MNNTQLREFTDNIIIKNAHDSRRFKAMTKACDIVDAYRISLDGVRSTVKGNVNFGDLMECIAKYAIFLYKNKQVRKVHTSHERQRDSSLKWLEIEIKAQANNQNLASFSDGNNAKRFVGIVFNGSQFEVKTFRKEDAIISARGKDLKLHLTPNVPVEPIVNDYAMFLEGFLNG